VGEIGRPHGVRGLVKLRSFTADPAAIAAYGPLTDESGTRRFALQLKADGLAAIEGIADRDAAARLTGTKLFVERDRLPPPEDDEFYLSDLVGMTGVGEDGETLGTVRAVEDHGGGAFLVLETLAGAELLLPFTRAVVPVVDIAAGRLTVVPPEEVVVPPSQEDAA
jgi:16S rRNA processing protein RimM